MHYKLLVFFFFLNLNSTADITPKAARSGFVCFLQEHSSNLPRGAAIRKLGRVRGSLGSVDHSTVPSPGRSKEQWGTQFGHVTD